MGAAIGYALAHSAVVSIAVFTAVALGLAAPYLLLAFNPAWTRLLPRPGAWMEVLKQAVSIPIFGTVIWLVWVFNQTAGASCARVFAHRLPAPGHRRMDPRPLARKIPGHSSRRARSVARRSSFPHGPSHTHRPQHGHPAAQDASLAALHSRTGRQISSRRQTCLRRLHRKLVPQLPGQRARRARPCRRTAAPQIQRSRAHPRRLDPPRRDIASALAALGRSGVPTYALYSADPTAPRQAPARSPYPRNRLPRARRSKGRANSTSDRSLTLLFRVTSRQHEPSKSNRRTPSCPVVSLLPQPLSFSPSPPRFPRSAARIGSPAPDFTGTDTNGQTHSSRGLSRQIRRPRMDQQGCPYTEKQYNSGNMQEPPEGMDR